MVASPLAAGGYCGGVSTRAGELLKGKYRLEELLGTGGMGEVYLARNTLVDRDVAIKILHPHLVTNTEVMGRFMREAKAANAVQHPNIVDVIDIDSDEHGSPFIVQEYLQGQDLSQRLEPPPHRLSARQAVELLIPIVDAVGAAHERGIVHRDLKPDNIYLAEVAGEIVPKILDFGISKVPLEEEAKRRTGAGSGPDDTGARLTMAGAGLGTPYYMSPEQIRDPASVDARTDVWAIGVIFYEALTGTMPFDAEDVAGLFAQIQTQDPVDLRRVATDVPRGLSAIVHRCLSPEPTARFPDAKTLASALREQAAVLGEEVAPRVASSPARPSMAQRDMVTADSASAAPPSRSSLPSMESLELDLPTSSKPHAKPKRKRPAAAPVQSDSDDPFDLAGDGPSMELAIDVPGSSSSPRGPRPRAAATSGPGAGTRADRGPHSDGRGIQVRNRTQSGSGAAGPIVAMIGAGALVVGTYLARERLTPIGVVEQQVALGGAVGAAVYAGIAAGALVATSVIAIAGMKRVAFSLLLATLGFVAVTSGAIAALGVVTAPGVVPPMVTKIGFLAAPWGAVVGCVGLAAFAAATARDLRSEPDVGWLAIPAGIGAIVCLGAAGWMVSSGTAVTLDDVQHARRSAAEPRVVVQAMRFGLAIRGAAVLEAAHAPPSVDAQTAAAAEIAGPAPTSSATP